MKLEVHLDLISAQVSKRHAKRESTEQVSADGLNNDRP